LISRLLREVDEIRSEDKAGQAWSRDHYISGFTSYASVNNLHRRSSTFAELEQGIDAHVKLFARALDFDLAGKRLEMTNCWVNIMPRHAHHGLHLHPLSVLSGTFYLRTPSGSSPLKFEDPRLDRMMASPARKNPAKKQNQLHVSLSPKAGDVILFESWLRHEVPKCTIAGERISISFNYA
jgi:uncharacterized protein (TIGR02466 family)